MRTSLIRFRTAVLGLGTVASLWTVPPAAAEPVVPSTSPHAAPTRVAAELEAPVGAITFSEFGSGTTLTTQYQDRGVVFDSGTPVFITQDGSNPTSPVLSGTPTFEGDIVFRIVDPITHSATTTDGVQLDTGYIDNPNSVQISYYDGDNELLGSVRANALGINRVQIPVRGISSVRLSAVSREDSGFAMDNLLIGAVEAISGDPGRVVSLGDSYSSGEGIGVYQCGTDLHRGSYYQNTNIGHSSILWIDRDHVEGGEPCDTTTGLAPPRDYKKRTIVEYQNMCHRSDWAWPKLILPDLGVSESQSLFVACSGAKASNVGFLTPTPANQLPNVVQYQRSPDGVAGGRTQLVDALDFADAGGRIGLVTVGVGGNDVGFGDIVQTCLRSKCLHLDDDPHYADNRLAALHADGGVFDRLVDTYTKIRTTFPDAAILTYGYPNVLDPDLSCKSVRPNPTVLGIEMDKEEREWAQNELLPNLNQTIADAAATAGITFMPIDVVTRGHEICTADPWIYGLVQGDDAALGSIGNESFHPNQHAHKAIAEYFIEHYTDGAGNLTFANPTPQPTLEPSPVAQTVRYGSVRVQAYAPAPQCGVDCIQPACSPTQCRLDVTVGGLAPNRPVSVTLHSDPVLLGELTTDANGDASGTFSVPSGVPDGLHELEVTGQDAGGMQQRAQSQVVIVREVLPLQEIYTDFVPVTPERLLDTRPGGVGSTGTRPSPGSTTAFDVVGVGESEVPANAGAVVLNITGVDAAAAGFVTVWPCGSPVPNASSLNLVPGSTMPNQVTVKVGVDGRVCLYTQSGAHLIADIAGYFPATSSFVAVSPERLLDTRTEYGQIGYAGGKPAPGQTVALTVVGAGASALPADAAAVVLNVTGADATGDGFVTAWPCGTPRPAASNLNLRTGTTSPNQVTVKIGGGGSVCLYTQSGTQLVADIAGFYPAETGYVPVVPERLLDTRTEYGQIGYVGGIPAAGSTVALTVVGAGTTAVPAYASSVVLNVTGTGAQAPGFVTVYPCGQPVPTASNLNLSPGVSSPNHVTVPIGTDGQVCLYTQTQAQLIADVQGYYDVG